MVVRPQGHGGHLTEYTNTSVSLSLSLPAYSVSLSLLLCLFSLSCGIVLGPGFRLDKGERKSAESLVLEESESTRQSEQCVRR